jgi:hypothetical protein
MLHIESPGASKLPVLSIQYIRSARIGPEAEESARYGRRQPKSELDYSAGHSVVKMAILAIPLPIPFPLLFAEMNMYHLDADEPYSTRPLICPRVMVRASMSPVLVHGSRSNAEASHVKAT